MTDATKKLLQAFKADLQKSEFENLFVAALEQGLGDEVFTVLNAAGVIIPSTRMFLPHKFCVDATQMPPYLRKTLFLSWLQKFDPLRDTLGLPVWDAANAELTVKFSCEEKTTKYGLPLESIKSMLRDKWGREGDVGRILDGIQNEDDFHSAIEPLMEAAERNREQDDDRSLEDFHKHAKMLEFEADVLGEYINSRKQIVLYVKNIEKAAKKYEKSMPSALEKTFESVFIHELFHAYHYADDDDELTMRHDYTSTVVKESLAAAFEWFYCVQHKIKVADDLQFSWNKHSVLVYPYSGANELLEPTGRVGHYTLNTKTFVQVFETSLKDMDAALRSLVVPNTFYDIKNLIHYRTKKVPVTTKAMTRAAFDAMMSKKGVGAIARNEIPPILLRKPHLAKDLLDSNYCDTRFCISIPILSVSQVYMPCGDRQYYAKPAARANGIPYFLYQQWHERHREALLDWIWANM